MALAYCVPWQVSRQRDEAVGKARELLSNGPEGPEALVREQIHQLQEDRATMLADRITMMEARNLPVPNSRMGINAFCALGAAALARPRDASCGYDCM